MPVNPIPLTNTCKRGCCWTPYGTCARQRSCSHHVEEQAERVVKEARESAIQILEYLKGK